MGVCLYWTGHPRHHLISEPMQENKLNACLDFPHIRQRPLPGLLILVIGGGSDGFEICFQNAARTRWCISSWVTCSFHPAQQGCGVQCYNGCPGMREFTKVSPALWQSKRFLGLPSDDGRLLYLYLFTCPHQNICGCFWLPDGYACNDLRWNVERYRETLAQLVKAELIQVDADGENILIERWFQHNPPMNSSHQTGIERQVERIPSEEMQEACLVSLNAACEEIEQQKEMKRSKSARNRSKTGVPDRLNTKFLNKEKRLGS